MAIPFPPEVDRTKPAIYSPQVVVAFSALFSGLAGGVLTYYSLRAAGQAEGARKALRASLIFIVLLLGLGFLLPRSTGSSLAIGLGGGWGYFLNEHYLKGYLYEEATYPRKDWVKPLFSCVAALLAVLVGTIGLANAFNSH